MRFDEVLFSSPGRHSIDNESHFCVTSRVPRSQKIEEREECEKYIENLDNSSAISLWRRSQGYVVVGGPVCVHLEVEIVVITLGSESHEIGLCLQQQDHEDN